MATLDGRQVKDHSNPTGTTKFLRQDGTYQVPSGGGAVSITAISVNVPYSTLFYKTTITDAAVSTSNRISVNWGAFLYTDANSPDNINFWAVAGTGNFDLYMSSNNNNAFGGIFKFQYLIG